MFVAFSEQSKHASYLYFPAGDSDIVQDMELGQTDLYHTACTFIGYWTKPSGPTTKKLTRSIGYWPFKRVDSGCALAVIINTILFAFKCTRKSRFEVDKWTWEY